jgi:glycosyl-4,4'-diaponeurosporenoate acyltransferase
MMLDRYPWWLLPVNVIAWGIAHSVTGYAAHRLPDRWCDRDNWLTRLRDPQRTERRCRFFGVRRWKDALPEAGAFFAGGVSKKHLTGTTDESLRQFAGRTRRAEMAHWMAFLVSPVFVLWNPLPIAVVMVAYAAAINAPFIATQRYNRVRVLRILSRRGGAGSDPALNRR